jgi:uncharacterized protein
MGLITVALVLIGVVFGLSTALTQPYFKDTHRLLRFGPFSFANPQSQRETKNSKETIGTAGDDVGDFVAAVLGSTEDVWAEIFSRNGLAALGQAPSQSYHLPILVLFTELTPSSCGAVSSRASPLYCPTDRRIYLDPDFFRELSDDMLAPGDLANAYVLSHEVAHHVQNELGILEKSDKAVSNNELLRNIESRKVELQADCLSGVWVNHFAAQTAPDGQSRLESGDIEEALKATHAVGDDTLGYSHEESFTHGSAEQRKRWFTKGFETGDPAQCDTFNARSL